MNVSKRLLVALIIPAFLLAGIVGFFLDGLPDVTL